MKYGLLYYKDTDNIGDDIQSYAASRFLPRIDYLVDRENLEEFIPDKKECVKVIMNAWYVHDKYNFDFSPYIIPLNISMFFKNFSYESGITVGTNYINDNVIETLKKYSPVGTRDIHTKKIMDKLNIDNYFSGCMTLTINRFDNLEKGEYIVAVGLSKDEINYIKKCTKRKVIEFKQDVKKGSFSNESWDERKKRVEQTLKLYQSAHMVVTTKLHCSLPCLALGTSVLLLYDDSFLENKDRIGTYLGYLNNINRNEFMNTKIDFENPKKNPKKYLKLRNDLEERVQKFINYDMHNINTYLPNIDEYKIYINKSRNMRKVPINQLQILQEKYEDECIKSSKMYDELNDIKYKYDDLKIKYNKIINSKIYKIFQFLKRLVKK